MLISQRLTVKNAMGMGEKKEAEAPQSGEQGSSEGGFLSGIGDKINSAAGGGKESEKNEDYLDKGQQLHNDCLNLTELSTD